jgi:hypothetical protein
VFVEPQVGVQSRHADIKTRPARDIVGVGFLEPTFIENVFRKLDHVDVVMIATSNA